MFLLILISSKILMHGVNYMPILTDLRTQLKKENLGTNNFGFKTYFPTKDLPGLFKASGPGRSSGLRSCGTCEAATWSS